LVGVPIPELGTQNPEIDELIRSAFDLYKQKKFDEALANCEKASRLNSNDFRPHLLIGYIYAAQRKLKDASASMATAITLQPRRKELYLDKARMDYLRNARDEALQACKKAIELDPDYAEAHLIIGNLLRFDEKRRTEAITALEHVIRIDPKIPEAYDYLGNLFASAKDEKRAEEIFRQGMAADPKRMAGRFELGRMFVKQGRLKEARELWEGRTSDEDRTHPQFIEVLKRAEDLKSATDALAKNPKDPEALINMGSAVMEGDSWVVDGRQKRAIVYFKQALEVKPDNARAQYLIVKAYIQIADTFKNENENVDVELAKLRTLDSKLAGEMEAYRKTYRGGIIGAPLRDQ
jgi:tetratricopeptide (TPR) repeat protein